MRAFSLRSEVTQLFAERRWSLVGYAAVLAALPFGGTVLSWSLIVCILCWLVDWNWSGKLASLRLNPWVWLFVGLYVLVFAGYFYSSDKETASFKLLQKLVLLVLPLCLASEPATRNRSRLLTLFAVVVALMCCVLELHAVWSFVQTRDGVAFFYDVYSYFMHTSYFAMLVSIALVIALTKAVDNNGDKRTTGIWFAMATLFCVNVLQSSSRAGVLGLALVVPVVAFALWRRRRFVARWLGPALIGLLLLTVMLAWLFSRQTRMTTLAYANHMDTATPAHAESGQVRLFIWREAFGLIRQRPFTGCGTGDVDQVLEERYAAAGMTDALAKHYNTHNQYLQTWVANGLLALILLLLIFAYGVLRSLSERNYAALGFFLVIGFHLLFESMLERREGLFAFALFTALFLCRGPAAAQEKSSSPMLS